MTEMSLISFGAMVAQSFRADVGFWFKPQCIQYMESVLVRETGDTFCKKSQCCRAPSNYLVGTSCSINCIIKQKGECTQLEVCCRSDVE